jgi:very-short-patch-repair endonuclease
MADRFGSSRGIRALRGVLAGDAVPTRSELEDTVLALILDAGFEQPDVNQSLTIEGRTVIPDFRWPAERLIVEADGAKWHDNPIARADDLRRQALLEAHGETVLRISWREATLERAAFVARLATAGGPRRDDSSWRIAR